jgi:hypothetical protein
LRTDAIRYGPKLSRGPLPRWITARTDAKTSETTSSASAWLRSSARAQAARRVDVTRVQHVVRVHVSPPHLLEEGDVGARDIERLGEVPHVNAPTHGYPE